jgi:hypothetical protein
MMFEDNVGEDGLSAQSSYTIDINESNYIDNLAPHPTIFDSEVPLGDDTFKKVYPQLIKALNDVRIQKVQIQPSLQCGMENLEILLLVKQKPVLLWSKVMTLILLIGVFITLVPISGCVVILGNVQCLKLQLKEQ